MALTSLIGHQIVKVYFVVLQTQQNVTLLECWQEKLNSWDDLEYIYIYIYIYIFPPLKKKNIYCQRRELAEKDTKESVSKTEHSQNVHYTQLWFKLQNDMGRS